MKAQHALGFSLSRAGLIVVFGLDIAILVLASHWPGNARQATYAWWSGVGIAVFLTIISLVTYHRIPLVSALGGWLFDRSADPATVLLPAGGRAIDHRRGYSRESVGIRESGSQLIAVIAVAGRPVAPAGRHHSGTTTFELPVGPIAAAMRQFDVCLEGIDIVAAATREAGQDADQADQADQEVQGAQGIQGAAADDSEATGGHSAVGHRSTWLVLRMDPQHNVAAVASRDSVAATLAAATERLTHDLNGRDVTARALSAEEFDGVDRAVLAGLRPRRPKQPEQPKQYVSTFWLSPPDISSENLDRLWLSDVDATVLTVRLVPRNRDTEVSAWVRYHSATRLHKALRAEVNRFIGRRLAPVAESLPIPRPHPAFAVPARELDGREQLAVSLDPAEQQPAVRVGAQP